MAVLKSPKFPEDFKVLYADGGVSYWHWHPETPEGYDGTWVGEPPAWSAGLMISTEESVQATLDTNREPIIVSWEFGPETESGPFARALMPTQLVIQTAVDHVIMEVNRQAAFAV